MVNKVEKFATWWIIDLPRILAVRIELPAYRLVEV